MTQFQRLAYLLWRAHSHALHSRIHGIGSAEKMDLSEETYAKVNATNKAAIEAGVRGVLLGLEMETQDDQYAASRAIIMGFIVPILTQPQPKAAKPPARNPNAEPEPARAPVDTKEPVR